MNESMKEFFGEPISVYTREQAIEDGVLMKNPSNLFPECDMLTTNLWSYIEGRCLTNAKIEPPALLNRLMRLAKDIYENEKFKGNNDKDFFVIRGNNKVKAVWFVRNENNKLTAMLAEDY